MDRLNQNTEKKIDFELFSMIISFVVPISSATYEHATFDSLKSNIFRISNLIVRISHGCTYYQCRNKYHASHLHLTTHFNVSRHKNVVSIAVFIVRGSSTVGGKETGRYANVV